jgi:hypothetical protein
MARVKAITQDARNQNNELCTFYLKFPYRKIGHLKKLFKSLLILMLVDKYLAVYDSALITFHSLKKKAIRKLKQLNQKFKT